MKTVRTLKKTDDALADISLWDLGPEEIKSIYAVVTRALEGVHQGLQLEIVIFGDHTARAKYVGDWLPERPFQECLDEVVGQERIISGRWNPAKPPCAFQRLLQYEIQKRLAEQLGGSMHPRDYDVRMYPSVGMDLDFFHGADGVVIIDGVPVTYDVTTDDDNEWTKADLLVHLHKTLKRPEEFKEEAGETVRVPHGIEFLAAWIVDKYFWKLWKTRPDAS